MLRKVLHITGRVLLVVLLFITIGVLFLHTRPGKNFVRNRLQSYLYNNYKITIAVGDLDYRLPDWIALNQVLLRDEQGDTLLWGGQMHVDLAMLKLLSGSVNINRIYLEDINIHINRKKTDSFYNFQFLVDAFRPQPNPADTIKKPLHIAISALEWKNIRVRLTDQHDQFYLRARSDSLSGSFSKTDIDQLSFSLKKLQLAGTTVFIADSSVVTPAAGTGSSSSSSPLSVQVSQLDWKDISVEYEKTSDQFLTKNHIDTLILREASFDLLQERLRVNELDLSHSSFSVQTRSQTLADNSRNDSTASNSHWQIECAHLDLRNNSVSYHDRYYAGTREKLDYHHLDITRFSLQATGSEYSGSLLKTQLTGGTLTINNELTIENIQAGFNKADSMIEVTQPLLQTQNSLVKARGRLRLIQGQPSESFINLNFDSSYIAWKDVNYLGIKEDKNWPVALSKEEKLLLDGSANGNLSRLKLDGMNGRLSSNRFSLFGSGVIYHADDLNRINYQYSIRRLYLETSLLSPSMRDRLEQQDIVLPASATITGNISGNTDQVLPDLQMQSSFGVLGVHGRLHNLRQPERLAYEVTLNSKNFATGKWIRKDSLLGDITGSIYVKGAGTDPDRLELFTRTRIESLRVNNYTYHSLAVEGNLHGRQFDTRVRADDPNLRFLLDLRGLIADRYPVLSGYVNINEANLQPLGWSRDTVSISSKIRVDIADLRPYSLQASIDIDSTVLVRNEKKFITDSVSFDAFRRNDSSFINLAAPFVTASLQGAYDYEGLFQKLKAALPGQPLVADTIDHQQADLSIRLTEHPLLLQFLPDLKRLDPVTINASFHSDRNDSSLNLRGDIPHIEYGKLRMEEGIVWINGRDSGYRYSIRAKDFLLAQTRLNTPAINGQYRDSLLQAQFTTNDRSGKEFYGFGLEAQFGSHKTRFHLTDNLLLNHQQWDIDPKNSVTYFSSKNLLFEHFYMGREKQSLRINNVSAQEGSPIKIGIDSFRISNLLYLLNSDSLLADGILNVTATIEQPILGFPAMEGTGSVNNLTLQKTPVGDLTMKMQLREDKTILLNGQLAGSNQADLTGEINVNTQQLNVNAELKKLTAKVIETASGGRLSRTSGSINGNIKVSGSVSDPRWTGYLNFDSTQLVYTDFNVPYRLNRQQIRFDYPYVTFNNFTITDSAGHPLTINGTARAITNTEFDLDLAVKTNDFIAINAPSSSQGTLSGLGILDADLVVKGNSGAADIQGRAILEDKSNISFTVPQANNFLDDRKSVVVFVDMDTLQHLTDSGQFLHAGDTTQKSQLSGIRYNLNLEVKENAAVKIIIDPVTNDQLLIKGTAQLNAGVDENGKLGINGVYQLKEGTYNMTYQFLKRNFKLQPGGTITFTGNPTDGIADITAIYEVEASPSELLGNEVGEATSGLGTAFTQKIPFEVLLKIKGPLLKPQLEFDIRLKEGIAGVNSTLSSTIESKLTQIRYDVSAINKQVFALLILNRFIGEQSSDFFAGSGFNPSDAARRSVSKFLAEAVDQIASDLIKGVNIDLDLRNYESDQNQLLRTDLNVALSSNFLNDRLTISVGKNFTLEGSDPAAKTQGSVQFIPDISTTYKLSKDGRYLVRAYRRNQYEAIMDGYFVETGVTFSITMSYNRFREIFRKTKQSEE